MPLKAPESYELDPSFDTPLIERKPHLRYDNDHEDEDNDEPGDHLSDIDEFDPLRRSGRQRYTDDASQPLRSVFDSDEKRNLSFAEKPLAWLGEQRRRGPGGLAAWFVPSKFCCALILLFVATLVLLLSAGGIWVYKSAGVPDDGQSEAWYPSPRGGTLEKWRDSYEKAAALVEQMTLVEKVNITTGTGWMMGPCVGNTGQVDRLSFPSLCLQDGPLGMRFVDNGTAFPAGVTVGATWSKELMYKRGKAMGLEAKLKGINVLLGPSIGPLGRLPAGGRNWEGFGPDPVLQGIAAALTIKGIQESGVMATIKHFVGNEQEHFRQSWEWGTPNAISSNIDDRTLHEIYAWPFADAIRAGVASVMCSYNQVNNSYACQNSKLLNGIVKDEMGFQGFIQSDWLAQRSGVASVFAGLDMTMPGDGLGWQDGETLWGGKLSTAILNGSVPLDRLDDMVLRVVAAWYQLGQDSESVWPRKSLSSSATFSSWTNDEVGRLHPGSPDSHETGKVNEFVPVRHTEQGGDHDDLARKVAAEGIVMVKNEDNVLPLRPDGSNIKTSRYGKTYGDPIRVGIFGEDAFPHPRGPNACVDRGCNEYTLGSGWGSGTSEFPHLVAPFDALNAAFDHSAVEVTGHSRQAAKHAGSLAETQDLCIVFANSDAGEGYLSWGHVRGDRPDLKTQKDSDTLIYEVAQKCGNAHQSRGSAANTIVVIHTVGPVIMEHWVDLPGVKAVLVAHLPGQESGNALADVIFGKISPSGHLPYTIAKNEDDYGPTSKILTFPNHVVPQQDFSEGLYIDYRYFDKHDITPRYEFGFGLSYTHFQLSSLRVSPLGGRDTSDIPAPRPDGISPPSLNTEVPDARDALWPSGFRRLQKYIYPYIDSVPPETGPPDLPYDPSNPHPLSPAGGDEGGNPDLYTPLATVHATVANLGSVPAHAVVQLYISYPRSDRGNNPGAATEIDIDMPVKVLRGFEKVFLGAAQDNAAAAAPPPLQQRQPEAVESQLNRRDLGFWDVFIGAAQDDDAAAAQPQHQQQPQPQQEVQFQLTRRDLSFWDVRRQNWVLPQGEFVVSLGFSSRDLPQTASFDPRAGRD